MSPALTAATPFPRYEAELGPGDQKLGGLRTALAQRPFLEAPSLGAVHLFNFEADEELQPS